MKNSIKYLSICAVICFAWISCGREFDDDPDYRYDQENPVFGDNLRLYSKVFRIQSTGDYLWFDLRNEVANFTKPVLNISFDRDLFDRKASVDLRGRLYSYDSEAREITFLNLPLDLFDRGEQPADIVCSLDRKQSGCDDLPDESQRIQCQRTYLLVLKRILLSEIDATLEVDTPYTYENSTVTLSGEIGQELYLIN